MKRYHMLKNVFIASLVATLYYGNIEYNVTLFVKSFGTLALFFLVIFLLRDADKYFCRRLENEKSAQP